ncbi:MAG TPA: hypothetical protein VGQ10_05775 [Vicinamibacterales bacterium]|jgi:hypothetical protein|nr:hypothetical protein [Vicinamibacterales bacterium]
MDVLAIVSVMLLSVSLGLAAAAGCLALIFYVISRPLLLEWDTTVPTPTSGNAAGAVPVSLSRELAPATVSAGR